MMVAESDAVAAAAIGDAVIAACQLLTEVLAPLLLCPPSGSGAAATDGGSEAAGGAVPEEFREDAAPGCEPMYVPVEAGQLDADSRLEADLFQMAPAAAADGSSGGAGHHSGSGGAGGDEEGAVVAAKSVHAVALFAAACEARERWILKRQGAHHPEVSARARDAAAPALAAATGYDDSF